MRFVIQRVNEASVKVEDIITGKIEKGLLVLVGITHDDNYEVADKMTKKLLNMRIFEDENGKTNKGLRDVEGQLLIVSQFTLYANCKHGNRPDFLNAAGAELANSLYEYIISKCNESGSITQHGIFGADMKVNLVNDGPFTIVLDSDDLK